MSLISTEHAKRLGPNGWLSPKGSITDPDLASHAMAYKRAVASRYRAVTPAELSKIPPVAVHVSPKIDGELWMMVLDPELGEVALVSPNQRVISGSIPLLDEARDKVLPRVVGRTVLAGELWAEREGGRPRVGDVGSALSGGEQAEVHRLKFAVFDLMKGHDAEVDAHPLEYGDRYPILQRLCDGGDRVAVVRTEVVTGAAALRERWDAWADGSKAEGLVVRTADHRVFKVKPAFHIDAVVIGFTERVGDDGRDLCRSVLLGLMREEGGVHVLGSCGNFGGDDVRGEFHALLAPDAVSSSYRYASSSGALYRFVEPKHVVEIKVTDIQPDDSSGRPIQRYVLEYEGGEGWRALRPMDSVSIIHPVFVRRREDKSVNSTDIRMSQVLERCVVRSIDTQAQALALPKSEVLRREVWTKLTKGQSAVRKLLVWKTNKDGEESLFPAFVVCWVDYSPGRKDPIKRTVRRAPTAEIAEALAEEFVSKGVKRGWNPA